MNNNTDKNSKNLVEDLYNKHGKKESLEHEYKYVASKDDVQAIRDKLKGFYFDFDYFNEFLISRNI